MAPPNADPPAPTPDDSPGDDGMDINDRFAEIVRDFHDAPPATDTAPGSIESATASPPRGSDAFPAAPWVRPPGPRDWPTTPEVEALEEAENRFTPPDPPLVLGRDPLITMAWVLVVGVPLLILVLALAWRPFPTIVGQVGAAAFLAGLAVLVWRMPHHRDVDDHDPGAVV